MRILQTQSKKVQYCRKDQRYKIDPSSFLDSRSGQSHAMLPAHVETKTLAHLDLWFKRHRTSHYSLFQAFR